MKQKCCRICLAMGVTVTSIEHLEAKDFIETIFKRKGFTQNLSVRHYVCLECKTLLVKAVNFVQKALRAQKVLYNILTTEKQVEMGSLKNINRHELGLTSILSYHRVEVDLYIKDDSNNTLDDEVEIMLEQQDIKPTIKLDQKDTIKSIDESITIDESLAGSEYHMRDIKHKFDVEFDSDPFNSLDPFDKTEVRSKSKKKYKRLSKSERPPDINVDNIIGGKRNRKMKKVDELFEGESDHDDCDEKEKEKQKKRKKNDDDDYSPGETTDEWMTSDSPYDSYDDEGKRLKKPRDNRVYPMQCDHCTYEIQERKNHFKHYLFCHPDVEYPYLQKEKFVCQFCGLKKRTEQRLREHELTHGEPTKKCPKCGHMCHNSTQLNRHMVTHSDRMFYCDYCMKGSKFKSDLRLHIRTHTGEKPFKCHICGAGFAHRGNVGIHIRSRHQNINLQTKNSLAGKKKGEEIKKRKIRRKKKKRQNIIEDEESE